MSQPKKARGFSLFEVLIFLILLSLLTLGSYLSIPTAMMRVRDAKRKSDLYKIRLALEDYYDSAGRFPDVFPGCNQPFKFGNNNILDNIPCDPNLKTSYFYTTDPSTGSWFKLYANLEDSKDPTITTLGCHQGCGLDCQYDYGTSSTNVTLDKCITPTPTIIIISTPTPVQYACSPGGGKGGLCEIFDDPQKSQCPIIFPDDPACRGLCVDPLNRCKNSSGKHVPG